MKFSARLTSPVRHTALSVTQLMQKKKKEEKRTVVDRRDWRPRMPGFFDNQQRQRVRESRYRGLGATWADCINPLMQHGSAISSAFLQSRGTGVCRAKGLARRRALSRELCSISRPRRRCARIEPADTRCGPLRGPVGVEGPFTLPAARLAPVIFTKWLPDPPAPC